MNNAPSTWLRRVVIAMALASAPALTLAPQVAQAADDEELPDRPSRKIKLRSFDEQANLNEEYARMAQQKRHESMSRLKGLLSKGVADETKAEMMLRLADLYFQEGRYLYLTEMAAYDEQFGRCFDDPNCDEQNMQANNSGSRGWQEKSIKLYQGILRNYPRYQRADQATFFLGSALNDTGREKEGVDAFKKLVKMYPQSQYLPDAYVLIGEYYFNTEGNAFGALKAYLKASQYKDSPKYSYAMYKLGWCYFNVGDYDKSIETMKAVVSYSMAQEQNQTSLQLQDEALKDLVRFFADADQMDEAIAYFNSLGKKELVRATLKRLAATFADQGKWDRAIDMYRRLILDMPTSTDNPEYQVDIINAYKKQGKRPEVLQEINKLRADYGAGSAWAQANASDPKAVASAQSTIEEQLRRIASDYHNTGKEYERQRRPETAEVYNLASEAYKTYLELFPTHKNAYGMHYEYGELLYKMKDFAGAFREYMAVVDTDPKGKYSKFCAESAIFSAEEQVKKEGGGAADGRVTAKATENVQPIALSEWEQRLVDSCKKFAELYPEEKKVRNIIYKSAYLLYNKYRFDEAATQFKAVIAMDPRSKEAEQAANLILDSLFIRKNWDALKTNSKFYYDQEGLGSAQFKKDVYEIYQNSSFKVIEIAFEADKDKVKAADGFVAWYEEFPGATNAALALNNSAAYYSQTGNVAKSMAVRHILVDDPKFGDKTKYYYDQIGYLGYDYESIADFDKASSYYEQLWALYPKEKEKNPDKEGLDAKAGDSIYSAAVFRNALGQWQQGITNYTQFINAFPEDPRIADIKLRIARIYEDNGQDKDAAAAFEAYYKSPPDGAGQEQIYFARLHHGQAMERLGDTRKRDAIYADSIKQNEAYTKGGGAPGAHTEFVAEMMFIQAAPKLEKHLAIKLKGAPGGSRRAQDKALEKSLTSKAKSLVETEKMYTEIVKLGAGEWGLASLVALGKAYEDFGTFLTEGDVPTYLTPDQADMYRMGLEDKAYVQEEKAINAYGLALQKSYELTIYNENTAYATRRLGELRPNDFPGLNEMLLEPRWTSSKGGKQFDFETSM